MGDHFASCQKCHQPATVVVTLDFEPGGTQVFRLCDDHAGYLYVAVVHWYSGTDGLAEGTHGPVRDASRRPQPMPR